MISRPVERRRRSPSPEAELLLGLCKSIREGVYIGTLDSETVSTLCANPHLKAMFGFSAETPLESIHPFAPDRFVDQRARDTFFKQLRRDGTVSDHLLRLRRTDNSSIWIEVTATLHPAVGARPARLDALVRDVSERRKLEDQGRDLSRQLVQSEKMATLGQTVSGVAHELNNPLATILTWAERLASRPLGQETKQGLETILSESERAAKIVRNLLTFAYKRNTTRALVDLNEVVRDTLKLRTYEQRDANVTTLEALAAGLPQVFADPHQIKQVLLNLIINSEQAMVSANGRGTLVLRTWYDHAEEMVMLEVNDDGPGVPDDVQRKIFDPFFTTKTVGKGTGLGLTVAYAIVQEHGGQIRIGPSNGVGASFFVSFPAPAAAPRIPHPVAEPPQAVVGASVLVVEDEPALATAVADALTDAGYQVERAADGQEGLERVEKAVFDLIICDLKMPRLDGRAFYRLLRTQNPTLARHVIFVTGDVAGTEAERFLVETGCRWLPKPFRLNDLLRTAHEVLG